VNIKAVSVIIPVYNEENNLEPLQKEFNDVLGPLGIDYEIIYINDGSNDSSSEILQNIACNNAKAKVIHFTKHFGQTQAIQAGIDYSIGDILVFLDADMQNDPKDIPKLISKMEEGYDVVSGWRKNRKDSFFSRKLPSYIANFLISCFSGIKLHDYGCTLKAYRKEVVKQIKLYSDMHRLLPMYAVRQGALIAEVEVSHRPRFSGVSKYNLWRIHKVFLDFLTAKFVNSYWDRPMYIFGSGGLTLLFLGGSLGFLIILRKVFFNGVWVSPLLLIMVILIIVGFQFILMGLLAEAIIRLYYRGTSKTFYAIKKIVKGNE